MAHIKKKLNLILKKIKSLGTEIVIILFLILSFFTFLTVILIAGGVFTQKVSNRGFMLFSIVRRYIEYKNVYK